MHSDVLKFKNDVCKEKGKVPLHLVSDCIKIFRLYDGIDSFDESFESDYQFLNTCYAVVQIARLQKGDDLPGITSLALEILEEEYEPDDIWQLFIALVLGLGKNEHLKRDPQIKKFNRIELEQAMLHAQMEKAS